ncbi:hypothetical protein AAF712_008451 [Marasmius tenuissimus]|uniref:Uncharacterized protein n=1 Tax=Marasmius tenuissimus TaxID=585030 RepID=A0ABR2ZTL3_9AGAR
MEELLSMAPFKELIELSPTIVNIEEACEEGRKLVVPFIVEWEERVKDHLRSEVHKRHGTTMTARTGSDTQKDLATFFFRCRSICGIDRLKSSGDVLCHLRCNGSLGWCPFYKHPRLGGFERIRVCDVSVGTVEVLLGLLGLDPLITLAEDMDRREDRFRCTSQDKTNDCIEPLTPKLGVKYKFRRNGDSIGTREIDVHGDGH